MASPADIKKKIAAGLISGVTITPVIGGCECSFTGFLNGKMKSYFHTTSKGIKVWPTVNDACDWITEQIGFMGPIYKSDPHEGRILIRGGQPQPESNS